MKKVIASIAILTSAIFLLRIASSNSPKIHTSTVQTSNTGYQKDEPKKEASSNIQERTEGKVPEVVARDTQKSTFSAQALSFSENNYHIETLDKNKNLAEELSKDPALLSFASEILSSSQRASDLLSENQAAGRVLAIKVLGARAKSGDFEPITDAVKVLGEKFHSLNSSEKSDLRDLLTEMIEATGPERFYDDPRVIFSHFQNPKEVRNSIIASSVAFLGSRINDPDFRSKIRDITQ